MTPFGFLAGFDAVGAVLIIPLVAVLCWRCCRAIA